MSSNEEPKEIEKEVLRQRWRERWLHSINELTSLQLQINSWLDILNRTNPHWSYIEFNECYLSDLGFDNYEQLINEGYVTQQEYEIVKQWHEELVIYEPPNGDHYNHEAILKDRKWLDIVQLGLNAKDKLSKLLSSQENEHLMEIINHTRYM